jgi:succinylglutamate desuccinylase
VQGAVAGARGDVSGVKAAKKLSAQGAAAGEVAKIQSYKEIANKKLQQTLNEIVVDLSKLGVNTTNFRALGYYNVIDTLDKTLDNIAQSVQSPAPVTP